MEPLITPETLQPQVSTNLHELCQKNGLNLKFVDLWLKTGEIEVYVDDELIGRGEYRLKRSIAHNRAAKNAYDELVKRLVEKKSSIFGLD